MRSKVTVVLLFLNVVLFFYIYKVDRPMIDARQLLEASHQVLPPEIASMDSFSRTSRTGETVRFPRSATRGGSPRRMTGPPIPTQSP